MSSLIYNILRSESKQRGALAFELASPLFKPLTYKEAVGFLQKEEKALFAKVQVIEGKGAPFYVAASKETLPLLKEAAARSALYIDKKKVIADFFSVTPLKIYASRADKDAIEIEPYVLMGKEIPFGDLDLAIPSSPPLLFKDGFLKTAGPDFDPLWIKRFLKEGKTFSVPGAVFAKWLKEKEELPECSPEFTFLESDEKPRDGQTTGASILRIRDTRGAFVDFLLEKEGVLVNAFDLPEAEELRKDLLDAGYVERKEDLCFYCPSERAQDAVELLLGVGWKAIDKAGKEIRLLSDVHLQFTSLGDAVAIKAEFKESERAIPTEDPLAASLKGKHLIPFKDGSYGLLPKGFLAQCAQISHDIEGGPGSFYIPKVRLASLEIFDDLPPSLKSSLQKIRGEGKAGTLPLMQGFQGELRPYQTEGTSWLLSLYEEGYGGILADEMGLGKTVQVIALLSSIPKLSGTPHLAVMPKSLLFNWSRELAKFFPSCRVHTHSGGERAKTAEELQDFDVILTSYPLLRQDVDLFKKMHFHTLILDEAQHIKNSQAKVSLAAKELDALFKVSLTGTPIENSIQDLFSHYSFLLPGLIKKENLGEDKDALAAIKRKIRPFLLRRKKADVAKDLPEIIRQTELIEMDEAQREGYRKLLESLRGEALHVLKTDGMAKGRFRIFEAILRLRQYACHPKLTGALLQDGIPSSAKTAFLADELEEVYLSRCKSIVFSQFTSMLDLIEEELAERKIAYLRLDGTTKNREEVVRRFQQEGVPLVFLISLKAGGVGLNLEQADYVFLYEPWWNEAVEEQAIARAHRIGRKSPVVAKKYIVRGTIEEKIMELKERKRSLATALIEDMDAPGTISNEDVEFLLGD